MKISFVTSTLHSGGSERVMALLANSLSERGYDVEIICINKHVVFYPIQENVRISFAEDEVGKSYLKKTKWLRNKKKKKKPDVVIAFMLEVYCMTLFALMGVDIPVISSERIDPHFFGKAKGFMRWVLLRRTTHLVVQTQKIKSFYSKALQKRTTIIPNPVTDKVFSLSPAVKEDRLIAVGRLAYQKNYPMMFEAFKRLMDVFPSYSLVIYGDGPRRQSLQLIIENLQLKDRVVLAGKTEKVIEEMNKSRAFLMTSDFEGMSNAMLEALCVGLPIITTEVSGARDLVEDGVNGFVTKQRDVEEFTKAIRKVLSDKELMERMEADNKNKAKEYQKDHIVDQWESLIHQIVKNHVRNLWRHR